MSKEIYCTICSKNYLSLAFSLYESYRNSGGIGYFVILLVDKRENTALHFPDGLAVMYAEDLKIPGFNELAFIYDITELNTAVKPTLLKCLLKHYGAETVTYLDPDTFFFSPPQTITKFHDEHSIVFSPHALTPHPIGEVAGERMYSKIGTFNLGFVSVRNDGNAARFLDWWEERCLNLCFNEPYTGLFVDQKWCNLAPVFFDGTHAPKHFGLNMGCWNLHERRLVKKGQSWFVNGQDPLVFYHFSNFLFHDKTRVSKHTGKLSFADRPDLEEIYTIYRGSVAAWRSRLPEFKYSFGAFTNGAPIPNLARKLYLGSPYREEKRDPFDHQSEFYKYLKRRRLLDHLKIAKGDTAISIDRDDWRLKVFHFLARSSASILGAARYEQLLKYAAYTCMPRNQGYVFFEEHNRKKPAIDFK